MARNDKLDLKSMIVKLYIMVNFMIIKKMEKVFISIKLALFMISCIPKVSSNKDMDVTYMIQLMFKKAFG